MSEWIKKLDEFVNRQGIKSSELCKVIDGIEGDFEKLQAENEQLKKELETWEETAGVHAKAMQILEDRVHALQRKLDLAVEALGFYANLENSCGGSCARQALKEIKEME